MGHPRLDDWLVENGHYNTRARALDAIRRGCITMAGEASVKPSRKVADAGGVTINDPAKHLVSRAGLKLEAALKETGFDPSGKTCLDIGASTGGFCQVLLNHGAKKVYGVDVGQDQLDESLQQHPRLNSLEGINARELKPEHLGNEQPEFLTCDVSFISLRLALPPALQMASPGARGIFLVKPQFEVGKEGIGRGGIVREEGLALKAATNIRDWFRGETGWQCTHFMPSPIKGGDGNAEYLMAGYRDE